MTVKYEVIQLHARDQTEEPNGKKYIRFNQSIEKTCFKSFICMPFLVDNHKNMNFTKKKY